MSKTIIRSRKTLTPQQKLSKLKESEIFIFGDEYNQGEILYSLRSKSKSKKDKIIPQRNQEKTIFKYIEIDHKPTSNHVEPFSLPPLIQYDLEPFIDYVESGLPLLFYGIGNKVSNLNEFILNFNRVIIISGYDDSLDLDEFKDFLEKIVSDSYHILIHDFDLLSPEWINFILSLDNKLIVSVSHVNCFLSIPIDIFLKFDITNYGIDSKDIKKDSHHSPNEIKDIIESLNMKEKEIYKKMILNFLETKKKVFTFKEVKQMCEEMLSLDDEKLKRFLKTLTDHHLIKKDNQDYAIPFDLITVTQISNFFEEK